MARARCPRHWSLDIFAPRLQGAVAPEGRAEGSRWQARYERRHRFDDGCRFRPGGAVELCQRSGSSKLMVFDRNSRAHCVEGIGHSLCRPGRGGSPHATGSGGGARSSLATGYPLIAPAGASPSREAGENARFRDEPHRGDIGAWPARTTSLDLRTLRCRPCRGSICMKR